MASISFIEFRHRRPDWRPRVGHVSCVVSLAFLSEEVDALRRCRIRDVEMMWLPDLDARF